MHFIGVESRINMNDREHYYYIDILRVLSSVMVIVTHVIMHNIYVFSVHSLSWDVMMLGKLITMFAVPCFFMISGALLLSENKEFGYKEFMWRRFRKIVIPFLAWSFIYYLYFSVVLRQYNPSIDDFFEKFLGQDISGHFWYMYALILLYILLPFLKRLLKNMQREETENLILVLFIFGSMFPILIEMSNLFLGVKISLFLVSKIGVYLNYMIVGFYIHSLEIDVLKKKVGWFVLASMVMLIFMFFFTYIFSEEKINQTWIDISWAPVFVFSVSVFSIVRILWNDWRGQEWKGRLLIKISGLSFTAYLLHMLLEIHLELYVAIHRQIVLLILLHVIYLLHFSFLQFLMLVFPY